MPATISQVSTQPIPQQPVWWRDKYPGEVRDRAYDVSQQTPDYQSITYLSVACAPSGMGEMQLSNISFAGSILSLTESSGQPGRSYTLLFTAELIGGPVLQWEISQNVASYLGTATPPAAPNAGFGAAIEWNAAMPMAFNFTNRLSSGQIAMMI